MFNELQVRSRKMQYLQEPDSWQQMSITEVGNLITRKKKMMKNFKQKFCSIIFFAWHSTITFLWQHSLSTKEFHVSFKKLALIMHINKCTLNFSRELQFKQLFPKKDFNTFSSFFLSDTQPPIPFGNNTKATSNLPTINCNIKHSTCR